MNLRIPALLTVLLATGIALRAQKTVIVHFDGKGRLHGTLPEIILKNKDKISFQLDDLNQGFPNSRKQLTDKLSAALARLGRVRNNADTLKLFADLFTISPGEIDQVIAELKAVDTTPVRDSSAAATQFAPFFKNGVQSYLHISTEHLTGAPSISFAPNSASGELPVNMATDGHAFDFTLSSTDPFKRLTIGWVHTTKGAYPDKIDFTAFVAPRQKIHAFITRITNFLAASTPTIAARAAATYEAADIPFLTKTKDSAQKLADELNSLLQPLPALVKKPELKPWILSWLWYQPATLPAVNPFPFQDPVTFGDAPDTFSLPAIRMEVNAIEAALQKADLTKMDQPTWEKYIAQDIALRKQLDSLLRLSTKYKNDTGKNDKQIQDFCTTGNQLYKGILLASDQPKQAPFGQENRFYWMRHHDAARNYRLMNATDAEEYLETDRVVILAHNLSPGDTANAHVTFAAIATDQSRLAEAVQPVFDQVTAAEKNIATTGAHIVVNAADVAKTAADDAMVNLKRALRDAKEYAACLDYLVAQTNPYLVLDERTDQSTTFHSEVANPPKKTDGPKKATYYLTTASANPAAKAPVADTFTYRINKLYRLFPMGGAFYSTTPFATIGSDSATKQSTVTINNHVIFVVGFKVYFKKTDIRNSSFFWSKDIHGNCLLPSRLSLDFAFDVTAPLNNLYAGAGLDLWPGCTLNAGAVFNQYTYNAHNSNGLVSDSRKLYRPGFFVGVSTDLSLFSDIGKFFNLSK